MWRTQPAGVSSPGRPCSGRAFPAPDRMSCGILSAVNDLGLALITSLITGGFTITAVVVTFGGNRYLDKARDRRADKQSRDSAIADLLTASAELVLAVNAARAAYQHRTGIRYRLMIAAALLQDLPNLSSWRDLTDRDVLKTSLRTATGLARDQDAGNRTIVLDYAGLVIPQASRFFTAVVAVTMGTDKELADAARRLGTAGAALLEAAGERKRGYARARSQIERELGKFRAVVDRRQ